MMQGKRFIVPRNVELLGLAKGELLFTDWQVGLHGKSGGKFYSFESDCSDTLIRVDASLVRAIDPSAEEDSWQQLASDMQQAGKRKRSRQPTLEVFAELLC